MVDKCDEIGPCDYQDRHQNDNTGNMSIENGCCTFCNANLIEIFFNLDEDNNEAETLHH